MTRAEDLVWKDIWAEVETKIEGNDYATEKFPDYISPDKNLGAVYLQAFRNELGF